MFPHELNASLYNMRPKKKKSNLFFFKRMKLKWNEANTKGSGRHVNDK